MQITNPIALALLMLAASGAAASDTPFTGVFSGTGRACHGTLRVHGKTVEWNSSFSRCEASRYEVLEHQLDGSGQRIVFRIEARGSRCLYEVFSLEQVEGSDWTADGYPSLEAFRKRDLPDWRDSSLQERLVLECPMTRLK